MIITVNINVPDGPTCYYEDGRVCAWVLKHTGSGQRWCRVFEDVRLERGGPKCQACREACEKAREKGETS